MILVPIRRVVIDSTSDRRLVCLWSLILSAVGLSHRVRRQEEAWQLLVPEENAQLAMEQLRLYERENRHWPPPRSAAALHEAAAVNQPLVLPVVGGLALFHLVTGGWSAGNRWFAAGALDRAQVIDGAEWWRLVTALTLHADSAHLLGNLFFGGLLAHYLGRQLGGGLVWLVVLLTALLANGINLLLQADPYHSVGFSTAVFTMVGILSGMRIFRGGGREMLLALGSGAGLLALLGSTGENVDLGAHFWGICLGFAVGLVLARPGVSGVWTIGPARQWLLFFGVMATVALCWFKAL